MNHIIPLDIHVMYWTSFELQREREREIDRSELNEGKQLLNYYICYFHKEKLQEYMNGSITKKTRDLNFMSLKQINYLTEVSNVNVGKGGSTLCKISKTGYRVSPCCAKRIHIPSFHTSNAQQLQLLCLSSYDIIQYI
jgi:hypothetical protein